MNLESLESLRADFEGRSVLVVGSAELLEPLEFDDDERLVTVNGSVSSVTIAPDLHLINARAKADVGWSRQRVMLNTAMIGQLAGRHLGTLVMMPVIEGCEEAFAARLRAQGTTWDRAVSMVRTTQDEVCYRSGALAKDIDRHKRLSAGLTAVALVLHLGARAVRVAGFSWDAGYAYLPAADVPVNSRGHISSDRIGVRNLVERHGSKIVGDLFTKRTEQTPR